MSELVCVCQLPYFTTLFTNRTANITQQHLVYFVLLDMYVYIYIYIYIQAQNKKIQKPPLITETFLLFPFSTVLCNSSGTPLIQNLIN